MHNISSIFLFLVFRDIIVANKALKPSFSPPVSVTQSMIFAMQWRHVIDIPRDLLL